MGRKLWWKNSTRWVIVEVEVIQFLLNNLRLVPPPLLLPP